MFSKIFLGLVLTTAFVPDMYSAEAATAESPFSPEITMLIRDAMAGKNKGSKEIIKGFSIEKLDDQTAPNGELLVDTRSKIDEVLTAEKYPDSGNYIELIKLDGLDDVYRVVSFTFNKDATNVEDKITNVQEIALVEIKKSGLEEHAHQVVAAEPSHEEHRAHAEEHAHRDVAAGHNHDAANRSHEHSQGHVVSALASPSLSDHLGNLFSANRVHSEEHVHAERVHSNEHLHQ